jgi:hypothetical protein
MALIPMRRNPLTSLLSFAAERDREAMSLGDIISQIAKPALSGMGVQTDEMVPQPAVMRGPVPTAQPLGPMTGPAMAPTLVDARETPGLQPRVTELLTGLESAYGQPLNVTSGYRSPEKNAAVGGAKGSQHMHGNAVDIDVSGMSTDERRKLIELAQAQGFTGVGIYDNSLHFDTGAERAWGPSYRRDSVPSWAADLVGGAGSASMSGGAGSDTMGGNNVEDILAQLYPQMSPEDEKRQRRKDFFAAASQGLSALSQGRPIDFSNIQANQENRKRQAVLDMRERERARSAASLVYSQTGDSELATGIATGAISYNDVLTERQTRRANELADQQRIRDAESAEAVAAAMKRTGLYNEEDIAAVAAGTLSADQLGSVYEQGRLAEELRTEAETKAEVAAQNVIDAQMVLQSAAPGSVDARAAERVIALGGNENVYDIIKARTPAATEGFTLKPGETRFGPGGEQIAAIPAPPGGVNEVADIAKANMLFEGKATNPQTNQAFASPAEALAAIEFYKSPAAAGSGVTLSYDPAGGFTFTQAAGGAPTAGGGVVEVAKPEAGTATVVQDGVLTAVPVEGAVAPQQAAVELAASQQQLEAELAAAPDNAARIAAEAKLAAVKAQQAQLEYDAAVADQAVDAETKLVALETAKANEQKAKAEAATLVADAEKQQTAEYANATRSFSVFENAAKDVLKNADNAWTTGIYGKIAMSLLPDNFATERSSFLEAAKQMGSQAMLSALAEAKAAGVTLTPVSNLDVGALGASQSRLSNPEKLTGEDIRKEVVFQLNFAKDALVGPKDLTRVDEFGKPYKTNADTLGLTEDTFARHWREIPPSVAEAWRNGELDALPTDDPLYAEASDTLNQHINNWQTYQGDLDRATVGVLPTPPEGISADDWPDIWLELSVGERAAYRKQAK